MAAKKKTTQKSASKRASKPAARKPVGKTVKKAAPKKQVKRSTKKAAVGKAVKKSANRAAAKKGIQKPAARTVSAQATPRKPANAVMKKSPETKPEPTPVVSASQRKSFEPKPLVRPAARPLAKTKVKVRPVHTASLTPQERRILRTTRAPQYNYMKAPEVEHVYEVGDTVEVFCDHEENDDRVRGWIKGIVVQVDNKMVAVQFRSNVFLTDGWMVPDRILWYPVNSDQIHAAGAQKKLGSRELPDY